MKYKLFLVVRVSFLDGVDPIDEIEKILLNNDFSWFAKYGQPIVGPVLNRWRDFNDVALSIVYKTSTGYRMASYQIDEITETPDLKNGTYPPYYNAFLRRVKTYIKISRLNAEPPTTDELSVRSSSNKLTVALRTSMRGYFVCRPT